VFSSGSSAIVLYGTVTLLLFGPLAFGAVEPWSIFILEAGSAALFGFWVIWQANQEDIQVAGNPLFLPMLCFAALVLAQITTHLTAYRYVTQSQALKYGAYGLLCFLVVQGLRRTAEVRTLAWVFSAYGFAVAAFALLQSLNSDVKLYWVRTPRFGGWIYGPYVNHNHYAGLMELLLPIPLVVALFDSVPNPRRALAAGAAALMASTIFLCGSRGGMVAFAVQMAIFASLLVKRRKGRKLALVLGIFLVITAGLLTWIGGGKLAERMESIHTEAHSELSGGTRLTIDRDGLKMFQQKPIWGWGLGVFPTVYPKYRSFYTNLFVNEAHNDYLQLLVEMGAVGFAIMLWFLLTAYYKAGKKIGNWTEDPNGALALAAMLGITGILVHSFVDFNLQVPANAALFYVLCVIAAMEPRFRSQNRKRQRKVSTPFEDQMPA